MTNPSANSRKGPPGNKSATKLKDPKVRLEAYKSFCRHISSGYPLEAFHFNDGTHSCCHKTILRYIEENPDEFPPNLLQEAKAARFKYWFDEGKTLMQGGYKCGSPVVWQTIMRNIFKSEGWDKDVSIEANKTPVAFLLERVDGSSKAMKSQGNDLKEPNDT